MIPYATSHIAVQSITREPNSYNSSLPSFTVPSTFNCILHLVCYYSLQVVRYCNRNCQCWYTSRENFISIACLCRRVYFLVFYFIRKIPLDFSTFIEILKVPECVRHLQMIYKNIFSDRNKFHLGSVFLIMFIQTQIYMKHLTIFL